MIDPVKAKIQELVPEIMELKEGCQVMVGVNKPLLHTIYGYDDGMWMAFLNQPFPKSLEANNFYDCKFVEGAEGIEILGSPITLAVLLRAILKEKPYSYFVDIRGNFWKWVNVNEAPIETGAIWNLEHDNYDQQSDECKQFIGSLLGV